MIVMSRKKHESIIINDDITVVVVEIRGDKVRLGIDAPRDVPFHRQEVYEAIRRTGIAESRAQTAEIKRKQAHILDRVRSRLAEMDDLDQLVEFEKKIG